MADFKLLTIRQVAQRYGLPENAVRVWVRTGELQSIKSGSRTYIHPAAIENMFGLSTEPSETTIS
jgi:excisionase family DNA binding protein